MQGKAGLAVNLENDEKKRRSLPLTFIVLRYRAKVV
jgi:hypothetical protein